MVSCCKARGSSQKLRSSSRQDFALTRTTRSCCPALRDFLFRPIRNTVSKPGLCWTGHSRCSRNHWQSSWVLANCYAMKGKKENADASYRRAVENAPMPDSNLLFSWGTTLESLGKRDAAIEVYRRAAVIDPDDQVIQRRLATLVSQR